MKGRVVCLDHVGDRAAAALVVATDPLRGSRARRHRCPVHCGHMDKAQELTWKALSKFERTMYFLYCT